MLVTSYPVPCDWSKPETDEAARTESEGERPNSQLCSTIICSQLINIETTLSETFTPNTKNPPDNNSSDYFSQHFENVIESVPTPTNSVSSSRSSIGHRDINYEEFSANGNVNTG